MSESVPRWPFDPELARRRSLLFETEVWLPASPAELCAFLGDPRNLDPVTPSWFRLRILSEPLPPTGEGVAFDYRMTLLGLPFRWRSRFVEWAPPGHFTYVQERGPYLYFEHEHLLEPVGGGTRVVDRLWYRVPGGRLADALITQRMLRGIFRHRARELERRFSGAPGRGGLPVSP